MSVIIRFVATFLLSALLTSPVFAADGGQKTDIKKYGDWRVGCDKKPDGKKQCYMLQNLATKKGGKVVMSVAIYKAKNPKEANCEIILPLGIRLPMGVGIQVDNGKVSVYPVQVCTPVGCSVAFKMTKERIASLKKGNKMRVIFANIAGKKGKIDASLKGFTKAIGSL